MKYIVGISDKAQLQSYASPIIFQAEQQFNENRVKQRLFIKFLYSAESWKQ
jgi:hypothetical protein